MNQSSFIDANGKTDWYGGNGDVVSGAKADSMFNNPYGELYTNNTDNTLSLSKVGKDLDIGGMNASQFSNWAEANPDLAASAGASNLTFDNAGKSNFNAVGAAGGDDTFLGMGSEGWGAAASGLSAVTGLASYFDNHKLRKKQMEVMDQNLASARDSLAATKAYRAAYGA